MSNDTTTVYKVVRRYGDGRFYSCYTDGGYRVLYELGQKSTPKLKNSKLFCFEDLDSAEEFVDTHDRHMHILECEAKISNIDLAYRNAGMSVFSFWKNAVDIAFQPDKHILFITKVPSGTVFCDWVKPIMVARYGIAYQKYNSLETAAAQSGR